MNTDPISDLLTRLRNAAMARHEETHCPSSNAKKEVLRVMKEKNFIVDFSETSEGARGNQKNLKITLHPGKILTLKRISKPGQRIYKKAEELFPVIRGYGFSIISTPQGVMTGKDARKKGIGGELICEAY